MRKIRNVLAAFLMGGILNVHAVETGATDPQSVLALLHSVADWQLANPSKHALTDWTQGAGYTGFMAVSRLPGGAKYEEAMVRVGEKTQWKLGPRCRFHADDDCIGQMYLDLSARRHDAAMMAHTREVMDDFCALNKEGAEIKMAKTSSMQRWTWCDALFMAPPVLAKLYAQTGDMKYHDTLMLNYKLTTDFLYDQEEHLYYRDSTYFKKREANGRKVFWGRGNGWVFGGLANILTSLPKDAPGRPYFETIFKQMAARVITLQQPDGLWRASLMDPANFPLKETSSSGFFCYGLAWGINNGLLDRATTLPVVEKAWAGLMSCVTPEGKLTHVQPVGADPRKFDPGATEVYGVGAFLLAGCEVYRLAQPAGAVAAAGATVTTVTVENPLATERPVETIEIPWAAPNATVLEAGIPIPSQLFEGKLLFQSGFGPGQSKTFTVTNAPAPAFPVRAYGRYVPERLDDYAWENDRIAFRIYGPALMEPKPRGEGLVSSGIDVWIKRTRNLILDKWYHSKTYHKDSGEGLDCFHVGTGRGCGGIGVLAGGALHVSRNWASQRTIATGPVRTVAEITYAPWDCGNGVTVAETRRIILDAGSNLNRFESLFKIKGTTVVTMAVCLDVAKSHKHSGELAGGADKGFLANWEAEQAPNGSTATAVLIPTANTGAGKDDVHAFLTAPARSAETFVWYAGAGWSRSGDFSDAAAWTAYVGQFSARLKAPLKITCR